MVAKPDPATTVPTLPLVPYPQRITSLAMLVETLVTCGAAFPNVAVLGRPELVSNGEAVLASLMPNIEAVEYPEALRVTVMTSLDRAPDAIAYHSSRFSLPVLEIRMRLANVRWEDEMLETLIDDDPT
jgi:hypothetical protein